MSDSSSSSSSGIGFVGLLTIVLITLKLLGKIDWSWWWVFSPMWISAAIVIAVGLAIGGIAILVAVASHVTDYRQLNARKAKRLGASRIPANTRDANVTEPRRTFLD